MPINFEKVPHWGTDPYHSSDSDTVSLEDFIKYIPMIQTPLGIDFESNAQDVRDGRGYTTGVSIAYDSPWGRLAHYIPFRHKYGPNLDPSWIERLNQALLWRQQAGGIITSHNMKADLDFADNLGISLDPNYSGLYCTLRMAHLIREELPYSKSLDACCAFYLKTDQKKKSKEFELFISKVGWENIPSEGMYEYARHDAHLHLELFNTLWKLWLEEPDLDATVWPAKRETMNIYRMMERNGVLIDTELCNYMRAIGEDELADLAHTLGVNPASPKGLQKLLIDELGLPVVKTTPGGRPSFDKEAMRIYDQILERSTNPTAQRVVAYRGWQKSVSSNYGPYVELLSPDGRLRPNYKLHGTRTGRASCEKPNLQQIPKVSDKPWNGRMKSAFIAPPGYVLIEGDYSQLELRLAMAYAQEQELLEVFNDPTRDIFTEMSTRLGMTRHDTKTLVYTISYGGGVRRISHVFGVSEKRGSEIREEFFSSVPGLKRSTKIASSRASSRGKVRIWSGRYRHFENPRLQAHKAFNAVIQGGAADIVDATQRRLVKSGLGCTDDCRMLLQVHDSLVFQIREDLVDKLVPEIKHQMEAVEPDFGVQFRADLHEWGK